MSSGARSPKAQLLGDIYETARSSIGLPVPPDAPAVSMFRLVIGEVRGLIRQRDAIEAAADALLSESADYKLLRRIPGIGPINALTILAEAGDLRRFSHHRQFLKFCGLDLATQQSGTFRAARPNCRSTATPGSGVRFGWLGRWPSGRGRTASATSSSATSPATGTMPTCGAGA